MRTFIVVVQRGRCDQLVDLLLIGWWWGKCESALSTFWFQLIWSLRTCGQLPSLTWWEFEYLQNSSEILLCVSLEWKPGPVPRLHYWFLTASPLSLHRFPFLISNCLNLPVGTQGRSRKLSEESENWGTQEGFCAQEPHNSLLGVTLSNSICNFEQIHCIWLQLIVVFISVCLWERMVQSP